MTSFENVTVLHDIKATFIFSNPRLLLQAAQLCKYPRLLDVMTFLRDQPLGEVLFEPPASNYSKSIMRVAPILGLEGSA